jgi:hypothetical protein
MNTAERLQALRGGSMTESGRSWKAYNSRRTGWMESTSTTGSVVRSVRPSLLQQQGNKLNSLSGHILGKVKAQTGLQIKSLIKTLRGYLDPHPSKKQSALGKPSIGLAFRCLLLQSHMLPNPTSTVPKPCRNLVLKTEPSSHDPRNPREPESNSSTS